MTSLDPYLEKFENPCDRAVSNDRCGGPQGGKPNVDKGSGKQVFFADLCPLWMTLKRLHLKNFYDRTEILHLKTINDVS